MLSTCSPIALRSASIRRWRHNGLVSISEWWPRLGSTAQEWLIANNGDAVPSHVLQQITAAGGVVTSGAGWVGERGPNGFYLSDDATDWIEAIANGESPG